MTLEEPTLNVDITVSREPLKPKQELINKLSLTAVSYMFHAYAQVTSAQKQKGFVCYVYTFGKMLCEPKK